MTHIIVVVMREDLGDDIITYMKRETIDGRVILSVPDIMKAFNISRGRATGAIAVLLKENKISEVKERTGFYFISEIMDICKNEWGENV